MKKEILTFFLLCMVIIVCVSAQEKIDAEMEVLATIELGTGTRQLDFYTDEEYARRPIGPYIDDAGILYFNYDKGSCVFRNGEFAVTNERHFKYSASGHAFGGQNYNGYVFNRSYISIERMKDGMLKEIDLSIIPKDIKNTLPSFKNLSEYIPVKEGFIVDRSSEPEWRNPSIWGIRVENDVVTEIIPQEKMNEWLSGQGSSFSIKGNDLYYGNIKYSAKWSDDGPSMDAGVARLRSGHVIHSRRWPDDYYQECFYITRPDGTVELELDIPWSYDPRVKDNSRRNDYFWGFGNYGELYVLTMPPSEQIHGEFNSAVEGQSDLGVVRNYLKYFGVLTDDRVRLRSGPSVSSENLGTYPKDTGFFIIDRGETEETISGDSGVWYHVRLLDGKEGYFFGAYVKDLYDGPGTSLPWPNVADWNFK